MTVQLRPEPENPFDAIAITFDGLIKTFGYVVGDRFIRQFQSIKSHQ